MAQKIFTVDKKQIFARVYFLDEIGAEFQISVYSFLDFIGDLGGLIDALFIILSALSQMYSSVAFKIETVAYSFKVKKTPDSLAPTYSPP